MYRLIVKNIMETNTINSSLNRTKVAVNLEDVKRGDIIYLSKKDVATPYSVLDIGTPFILIENMRNHFANLYRPTIIYKEQ